MGHMLPASVPAYTGTPASRAAAIRDEHLA